MTNDTVTNTDANDSKVVTNSIQKPKKDVSKAIDRLKEDLPIPRQNWVCISFLSPEGIKNCSLRGLKIRGTYDTKEEAKERCEELQAIDSKHHVFVGEVGKWLPWDPDPNSTKDQVYQEKELNDLMEGYEDNLKKATKMQEQRKDDMMKNAAYEQRTRKEVVQERLQKKLAKKKMDTKMETVAKTSMKNLLPDTDTAKPKLTKKEKEHNAKNKELTSKDKVNKIEKDRLIKNDVEIHNQKTNLKQIDNKLDKIKTLYKKLQDKSSSSSS